MEIEYTKKPTMNKKKIKTYLKKKHIPEIKIIEALQSKYSTIDVTKIKIFNDLPLSQNTLKGLMKCDYVEMTDIQRQSIGFALQGNDILGAAKTGSGKTLAFLIPIVETLYCKQWTRLDGLGALVITPTRELAYQIYETLRKIGEYHDISAGLIIGGKDLNFEKKRMNQCNIVICTPGRLLQHMDENPLFNCTNMQILVLDEADRCLDMGFEKTMNSIIENLPANRQTLLFSATQTKSVKDLARLSLKDPLYVSVHEHSVHTTPETLQQSYIVCALEDKIAVLWSFIRHHLKQKIIVFFSSCKQVKYIYQVFCRMRPGCSLLALYGTLHQLKRMDIYDSFCRKQHAVLFATDIAARGLDFPAINWVIQMDCPEDVNAYIHRAGRTARFKSGGESLLILLPSEQAMIEKLKQRKIPINMIEINPNKLQLPERKLAALLSGNEELKETAQKAFVAYIKSVFLMKDKEIFNVHDLNINLFANSLGLLDPPRVRFLQRMQKKMATDKIEKGSDKTEEETDKTLTNLANNSKQESNEDNSDSDNSLDSTNSVKEKLKNKMNVLFDDADACDIYYNVCDTLKSNLNEIGENILKQDNLKNKDKSLTKIAAAKKILKNKKIPNKKIIFNEEGQALIDSTNMLSELGRQYAEGWDTDNINIEIKQIEQVLQEEDRFDKVNLREKLKKKRREEKRKLKARKKAETDDEDEEKNNNDNVNEDDFRENEYSEDESSEGPDLSWLPDPDKIYGKQQNSDEEESMNESEEESKENMVHRPTKKKLITKDVNESKENEYSEDESNKDPDEIYDEQQNSDEKASVNESEKDEESEENMVHSRSSKRKLAIQKHEKIRKKMKVSDIIDLKTDEELALQLLQN